MTAPRSHRRSAFGRRAVNNRRSPAWRGRPRIAAGAFGAAAVATALAVSGLAANGGSPAATMADAQAASLPGASSTPNVAVNFGASVHTLDPNAIGLDESTYGNPTDATDTTAQGLLKTLDVGYSRIGLTLSDPASPDSTIVCMWEGCNTSISSDTWISEVKAMGMTPIVAIPDTLSAADAAAIVTHFNTATGNPVHWWVIGNEPDVHSETAATYSSAFNAMYDAMKTADPSIKIGGGTTAWYDSSFLTTFLQDSGSRVDFVDMHYYPGNDTLAQLMAAPAALSTALAELRTLINTEVPTRASAIAIHLGEYNMSWVTSVIDQYGYTGIASVVDADILGRTLASGDDALAFATKNGPFSAVFGDSATTPPGYSEDIPTPLYEAIGMFTGEGLFPHFGDTVVSATSDLSDVDAFASSSPDEIVLVNKSSSAQNTMVHVTGDSPLTAAVWQIDQTGQTPSAPARVATYTTSNGSFSTSLSADSVTTMVVTSNGTASTYVTATDAQTGRCVDSNAAGSAYTLACNGGQYQAWRLSGLNLIDEATNRCLDSNTTGSVYTTPCNGGNYQAWYNLGSLLYDAQTGRCLDSNTSGSLYTLPCNGGSYQNWKLSHS